VSATDLATAVAAGQEGLRATLAELGRLSPLDAHGAEAAYVMIRQLYEHDQLDRASRYLQVLVSLRPGEGRYWFAWGLCLKRQERYEDALGALQTAALLGHDDGQTSLKIAECELRSGAPAEADRTLAGMIERCRDQPQAAEAVRRGLALRRLLAGGKLREPD